MVDVLHAEGPASCHDGLTEAGTEPRSASVLAQQLAHPLEGLDCLTWVTDMHHVSIKWPFFF